MISEEYPRLSKNLHPMLRPWETNQRYLSARVGHVQGVNGGAVGLV